MTKQAATLYRAMEHYLAGCQNEPALEYMRLAVGKSLERGETFDRFLARACQAYLRLQHRGRGDMKQP